MACELWPTCETMGTRDDELRLCERAARALTTFAQKLYAKKLLNLADATRQLCGLARSLGLSIERVQVFDPFGGPLVNACGFARLACGDEILSAPSVLLQARMPRPRQRLLRIRIPERLRSLRAALVRRPLNDC